MFTLGCIRRPVRIVLVVALGIAPLTFLLSYAEQMHLPAALSPLPDYVIPYINITPSPIIVGKPFVIKTSVKNFGIAGSATASVSITIEPVLVTINPNEAWDYGQGTASVAALGAGLAKELTWSWIQGLAWTNPSAGLHRARVCVITPFAEYNSANNCHQVLFEVVKPAVKPAAVKPSSSSSGSKQSVAAARKDKNGCLIDQGFVWCARKKKCIQPWRTLC